jgi:hypothetical protein
MQSDQAKAFYDATYQMVEDKTVYARINVFSNSEDVDFGSYSGKSIDIGDIELLNNFGGKGGTKGAGIYRELYEQNMRNIENNFGLEKASKNYQGRFEDTPILKAHTKHHDQTIANYNLINGNTEEQIGDVKSFYYTRFFEKDGTITQQEFLINTKI